MSDEPKLKVLARGSASVPHYEAAPAIHGGAPPRRVSHVHEPFFGARYIDSDGHTRHHGAWVKRVGEVREVPNTREYAQHLREGDMWPADDATAQVIGFPFSLKGEQLEKALAGTGTVLHHNWRELALRAVSENTSLYEQIAKARDEEHGDEAVAAHKAAVEETRESSKPKPGEQLAKPKGAIV